jgi:GNAT superfamily N-acetyltransferase
MKIKKANIQDLENLVKLFDAYRVFYELPSDLDNSRRFLSERISKFDSEIFVAEYETNQLVGFVQLYPLFSSTRMKRLWLLNDLYVMPEHRGKGISKELMERCKSLARESNACGLMLETAKSNRIGNQLYPSCGFVLDQDHHYYSWNE